VGLSIVAVDVDPPEYLFVSSGSAQMLGYTVEELIQIPIWDLFASEELPALRARHKQRLGEPTGTRRFELALKHRNGATIPVEVTSGAGRPTSVSRATFRLRPRRCARSRRRRRDSGLSSNRRRTVSSSCAGSRSRI
jgi:PAS domain S-box-containing protein